MLYPHNAGPDRAGRREGESMRITCSFALLLACSCAYPISQYLRDEAKRDNLTFAQVLENPEACKGRTVIWGGQIIEARDVADGTEFFVLQTRLDSFGVPSGAASSQGCFIARSPILLDTPLYTSDKDITIAGVVLESQKRGFSTYPAVLIQELYLWEVYPDSWVYFWH
jgi:outer membrane lipoprotein